MKQLDESSSLVLVLVLIFLCTDVQMWDNAHLMQSNAIRQTFQQKIDQLVWWSVCAKFTLRMPRVQAGVFINSPLRGAISTNTGFTYEVWWKVE